MFIGNNGLSVIVPAYNEEAAVGGIVKRLKDALDGAGVTHEIIVVDDGSSDNTAKAASSSGVTVIRHPKNLGYGKAIVTGFEASQYDTLAIIDADDTYLPEDLIRMLPLMDRADMVIGVRKMDKVKQNFAVTLLRLFLKSLILYFTGYFSPDPNSGLRVFKKDIVIRGGNLFSLKFSFSTSLTFFAHLTNRFVEYLSIDYRPRVGYSKVRHLRDSFRTFLLILRMAVIYRPLKIFATHTGIAILGFMILFFSRSALTFEVWLVLLIIWFVAVLFIAFGYIAFSLSQIYAAQQTKK